MAENIARVEILLTALFLDGTPERSGLIDRAAADWVGEWLGLGPVDHFGHDALRHLVAVQLAPREAIAYELSNPIQRWRLIDEYLQQRLDLGESDRHQIARTVALILDHAGSGRGRALTGLDSALRCAICRMPFNRVPRSVSTRDPYKPTWRAALELCRPEVDHVVPVSSLGRHTHENTQIVCRACNMAKGSGLVIDPESEVRFAGAPVERVPRIHLFRLLQWLVRRGGGMCERCGDVKSEVTLRLAHRGASLTRANVRLLCYDCAEEDDCSARNLETRCN